MAAIKKKLEEMEEEMARELAEFERTKDQRLQRYVEKGMAQFHERLDQISREDRKRN